MISNYHGELKGGSVSRIAFLDVGLLICL